MHLPFDRPVLVDVVKDVAADAVGGFIYPFSEFATPTDGTRQAARLSGGLRGRDQGGPRAVGGGGPRRRHQGAGFPGARRGDLQALGASHPGDAAEGLNIQCNLRTVVESVWFDDAASGNYDLAIGAIVSTLLDPSDYFNAWYRTGGPQNYSFWHNEKFDSLVRQIDREVDAGKRLALIRRAEAIMEQDPPLLPVAWEKINDVWYNYVKGHNPNDYFGIYDVVRFDTFWLDKA